MYNTLVRLYDNGKGKLTKTGLKKAVTLTWITAAQYKQITGEDYAA
jgi:hypothetical protein